MDMVQDRDYIAAPTKALIEDPHPLGLPEIFREAHLRLVQEMLIYLGILELGGPLWKHPISHILVTQLQTHYRPT